MVRDRWTVLLKFARIWSISAVVERHRREIGRRGRRGRRLVTCWLTQQWEPMDSAATIVPTPCLMKSTRPIRSASRMSCGHRPVQHAKQKSQRQRQRAETIMNETCATRSRPRSSTRITSIGRVTRRSAPKPRRVPGAAINQAQREAALTRSTFKKSIANKPL